MGCKLLPWDTLNTGPRTGHYYLSEDITTQPKQITIHLEKSSTLTHFLCLSDVLYYSKNCYLCLFSTCYLCYYTIHIIRPYEQRSDKLEFVTSAVFAA